MEGLGPLFDTKAETETRGLYAPEWLKLKDAFPVLFTTKNGLVVSTRAPLGFEGEVVSSQHANSSHKYRVVLTNTGEKPKFNPNKLNFYVTKTTRVFSRCLVSDCKKKTSSKGNFQGLCQGKNHKHLEAIEGNPEDITNPIYYLRYTHNDGHLVTEGPMDYATARARQNSDIRVWGPAPMNRLDHFVDWVGVLKEEGSTKEMFAPWHAGPSEFLLAWMGEDDNRGHKVDDFVRDVLKNAIVGHTKDSTTLQLEYERGGLGPKEVCQAVSKAVEQHFQDTNDAADWKWNDLVFPEVPIKVAAAMLAIGFAAEEANRGDYWFSKEVLGQPSKSDYASAYMSSTYYFLRRAGATSKQAQMSQRV